MILDDNRKSERLGIDNEIEILTKGLGDRFDPETYTIARFALPRAAAIDATLNYVATTQEDHK